MDKVKLSAAILAVLSAVNLVASGIFGIQLFADGEAEAVANGVSILVVAIYGIYLKLAKDAVEAELAEVKAELKGIRLAQMS